MKFFRIFLWSATGLVMTLVAAALVLIQWPQLLINGRSMRYAAWLATKAGYPVTWSDARVRIQSKSFLRKKLDLRFNHLCVSDLKTGAWSGCFAQVELSAEGSFSGLEPRLIELGPLRATGGRVRLDLDRPGPGGNPEKKTARKPFELRGIVPAWIRQARIGPVHIGLSRWMVTTQGRRYAGDLDLIESDRQETRIRLGANASSVLPMGGVSGKSRVGLVMDLVNPKGLWSWNHWVVDGNANGKLADGTRLKLRTRVRPRLVRKAVPELEGSGDDIALDYGIEASVRQRDRRVRASLDGRFGEGHLYSVINATATNLSAQLTHLRMRDCELSVNRREDGAPGSRISLNCPMDIQLPLPPESLSMLELPTESGIHVKVDLASSDFIPSPQSVLTGKVAASLDPVMTPAFRGDGSVSAELNGRPSEYPKGQGWGGFELALSAEIPDFQKLVSQLDYTAWSIPAPIRVLKGDVRLELNGRAEPGGGAFPLRLSTRLRSRGQSLTVEGKSLIRVDLPKGAAPEVRLDADLLLSDVRIELPRLANPGRADFEPPPRLLPDDRIISARRARKKEETEAKEKARNPALTFDYVLHIRTPSGHPVQIVTNLAKGPVPIDLNLTMVKGRPVSGNLKVESFPVEFFNRKATVEYLDLTLQNPVDSSPVDGMVRVPVSDFIVLIQIVGTAGTPHVVLNSEPPLPQSQLLSLLLYGVPPNSLEPDQGQTVGSAQAALSAGALNLASLYFLASTPIQSISYDPTTGSVVASVKLVGGASLNIGAGSAQTGESVGISKRLGRNFYITSDVEHVGTNLPTQVTALLEWAHRY